MKKATLSDGLVSSSFPANRGGALCGGLLYVVDTDDSLFIGVVLVEVPNVHLVGLSIIEHLDDVHIAVFSV